MAHRLTDKQMDQLENWIGKGPKRFSLIYKITRDGCGPKEFHQHCDNQGPTVTVLYNPHGSVYGGYTSVSWKKDGSWGSDSSAFLFQLNYSGQEKINMFPCKNPQHAVNHNLNGPQFGWGGNLCPFSISIPNTNGVFKLNGGMSYFGRDYDANGVTSAEVNNGTMDVIELEVYKVEDCQREKETTQSLSKWRNTMELSAKTLETLTGEIQNFKPLTDIDVQNIRLLLLGPVGAGKSSVYNTFNSVFRGRLTQRAPCGSAGKAGTTSEYTPYEIRTQSGSSLRVKVCDTPGFDVDRGLDIMECAFLLDGHVPEFYKFNYMSALSPAHPDIIKKPAEEDKVQCVVFVLDASTLDDVTGDVMHKIKYIRHLANQRAIPVTVILTKIDKASESVRADVSSVFSCAKIENLVSKASELMGVPRNNVFPMKNYEAEVELHDDTSVLALMALRKCIHLAQDYMENLAARK